MLNWNEPCLLCLWYNCSRRYTVSAEVLQHHYEKKSGGVGELDPLQQLYAYAMQVLHQF